MNCIGHKTENTWLNFSQRPKILPGVAVKAVWHTPGGPFGLESEGTPTHCAYCGAKSNR